MNRLRVQDNQDLRLEARVKVDLSLKDKVKRDLSPEASQEVRVEDLKVLKEQDKVKTKETQDQAKHKM